jgi:hypothetical protein
MLVTPHAVVGATMGVLVPARFAVCTAVASHFLLDAVPHWQETLPPYTPHRGTWVRVPIDMTLALILTRWIARRQVDSRKVWLAAFAGVVPDVDVLWFLAPRFLGRVGVLRRYVSWHADIQRETSRPAGIVPQLGVIALCGAILRSGLGRPPRSRRGCRAEGCDGQS